MNGPKRATLLMLSVAWSILLGTGAAQSTFCTEQHVLTAKDKIDSLMLGQSTGLSESYAIMSTEMQQKVYVYSRSGTTWSLQTELMRTDPTKTEGFGKTVGISETHAVVGAYFASPGGLTLGGMVYVYSRNGEKWEAQMGLTPSNHVVNDLFGESVAISASHILVGAYGADPAGAQTAGAAYVFTLTGSSWVQAAMLTASQVQANAWFGMGVAVTETHALVAAKQETVDEVVNAGATYVFAKSGATWTLQARLTAATNAQNRRFGNTLALSSSYAIVTGQDSPIGSAFVFSRNGNTWQQQAQLFADDTILGASTFGSSSAITDTYALVGSWLAGNNDANMWNYGAAYLFTRSGATWAQAAILTVSDKRLGDGFGISVALTNTHAFSSARMADVGGSNVGAGYIFQLGGSGGVCKQGLEMSPVPTRSRSRNSRSRTRSRSRNSRSLTKRGQPNANTPLNSKTARLNQANQQDDDDDGGSDGAPIGAIVGGSVGGVAVVAGAFYLLSRKKPSTTNPA